MLASLGSGSGGDGPRFDQTGRVGGESAGVSLPFADHRRNTALSREEIFEILSNERRRGVVQHLERVGGETTVSGLVDAVADWEHRSGASRASVYTSLIQVHLPRMDEIGVLEFDSEAGVVEPTERLDEVQLYLEYSPEHDIPWAEYYLGLAAVAAALLAVAWLGVGPFDRLGGIAVASVVVAALLVSAVAHLLETRRHRLGSVTLEKRRKRGRDDV